MSWAVAMYLGVAALGSGPCVVAARRLANGGRVVDVLVTAALLAVGWPITFPLFAARLALRRGARPALPARPQLRLIHGAAIATRPAAGLVGAKH